MSSLEDDAHVQELCEVFLGDILKTKEVPHGKDRTLFDHLYGTARMLASWGENRTVCYGGLFHSIYGTTSFKHSSVPIVGGRDMVINIIGGEAEELAFLFCMANRATFPWAVRRAKELYTIEAANLMDQKEDARHVAQLLPWLTGEARTCANLYSGR